MTTEDDFRRRINRVPHDDIARLVFADWLEERGDPRSEGFRALARSWLFRPYWNPADPTCWVWFKFSSSHRFLAHHCGDWWQEMDWGGALSTYSRGVTKCFRYRFDADSAAALAFTKLPAARRAELLNPTPQEPPRE